MRINKNEDRRTKIVESGQTNKNIGPRERRQAGRESCSYGAVRRGKKALGREAKRGQGEGLD